MKNLEVILSISATCVGLLVTLATVVLKFVKSAKARRIAEGVIKVGNAVLPYVNLAETFVNYSGQEKKEYVLTKANQFAIENGIEFDGEQVSARVEELVSLTKTVNKRDKDKICAATSANASEYAQCMKKD